MTKILLVEDDKSLREIYGVRLLAEGYDIVSAGDGEEALAMAIKERPQLIVSDVMMPKISGFDMLDILRSTTETKDIKVIMMTALSSEDQRARGQALGADRYLVKSQVGIEDVVRTVHEVLADAPTSGGVKPAFPPTTSPSSPLPPRPTATVPARPQPPVYAPTPAAPAQGQGLPQPTAPFSGTRPASLGERVIHPLTPVGQVTDMASRMNEELQAEVRPPQPAPVAPPASIPVTPQVSIPATPPVNEPSLPPLPVPPVPPTPTAPPYNPPAPAAPVAPASTAPSEPSGLQFEETPLPPIAPPTNKAA